MTGFQLMLLIAGLAFFDLIVLCAVMQGIVAGSFGALAKKCPNPAPPLAPDALYREFQDMRFGMSNLGKSVHIGVDESGLHLFPARILRWAGAKPVTVPWTMIELIPEKRSGSTVLCTLAGIKARAPAWCFDQKVETPSVAGHESCQGDAR